MLVKCEWRNIPFAKLGLTVTWSKEMGPMSLYTIGVVKAPSILSYINLDTGYHTQVKYLY